MMSPPRVFPGHAPGPHGHGPRLKGRIKVARRDVLLQCDTCSAVCTARVIGDRTERSALAGPGLLTHRGCGGHLVAFDIATGESV